LRQRSSNTSGLAPLVERPQEKTPKPAGYRPIWDAAKSLCADAAEQPTACQGDAGHHCSDSGAACRAGATDVPALPFPAALKEARSQHCPASDACPDARRGAAPRLRLESERTARLEAAFGSR